MPRVRLDIADDEDRHAGRKGPDIRIDTEVFDTLSVARPEMATATPPAIVRWLDCLRG